MDDWGNWRGVRWHDIAFPRRDMSRRTKARTCPRTPKRGSPGRRDESAHDFRIQVRAGSSAAAALGRDEAPRPQEMQASQEHKVHAGAGAGRHGFWGWTASGYAGFNTLMSSKVNVPSIRCLTSISISSWSLISKGAFAYSLSNAAELLHSKPWFVAVSQT